MKTCVIFGGTGFIGVFFAQFLLEKEIVNKIYLVDIEPVNIKVSNFRKKLVAENEKIFFIKGDIRQSLNWFQPSDSIELIANFAAVHREPGHEDFEYYETNLLGAENVCAWADQVGCSKIIFTSSIAPYGLCEQIRDEKSLVTPNTPYGSSKLVAEKIHQIWQARDDKKKHLVIVRPGVVFGPGEGGNVSRLIKAVLHRYFFYMGNQNTHKAGVYIKELCNAMWWVLEQQQAKEEYFTLFNMSMSPGPSIKDYVNMVCRVARVKRFVPNVPHIFLLCVANIIESIARPLGIKHPFSPIRINKLIRSNNIVPSYLIENHYEFIYNLEQAFLDWKKNCTEEWS